MSTKQLKELPSVSEVLLEIPDDIGLHPKYITHIINSQIGRYRRAAKGDRLTLSRAEMVSRIVAEVRAREQPSLKNLINGTGIVLHTGLGRAPVDPRLIQLLAARLEGYVNLEFDLDSGRRGERQDHIATMLASLVGAEAALMVNNNAAAVLLTLNTLAEGREVIVSRGQEVEIGGSFRIPDVVRKSNCILREVGTTNRTHRADYEGALGPQTAGILWVHSSNYIIKGFTLEVGLADLADLAHKRGLVLMADLGSGALVDLKGLPQEIQVSEVVSQGVDLVTFSGDKLLGGPQAGLIVGKKKWIRQLQSNPLYRALRCDKWNLALMELSLRTYTGSTPGGENLALTLLTTPRSTLRRRGQKILAALPAARREQLGVALVPTTVEAGSGSLPLAEIESMALQFKPSQLTVSELARRFRQGADPVVGYIAGNRFYIDLKAVLAGQIGRLIAAIREV